MGYKCIKMALFDLYVSHPDYLTRLVLSTKEYNLDIISAAAVGTLFYYTCYILVFMQFNA